ncbi:MAG: hypothetical protein IKT24_00550 [Clostridia bacterium]|nr:hypothetical protein [Clostridia bacterium]
MRKRILTIVFCSFILIFSVLTVLLPKKASSENEKRILATFPEVTVKSITDGSFMTKFDTYVADHFAFRDKWVGAYSYARLAIGLNGAGGVYAGKDGYLIAAPADINETSALANVNKILQFANDTKANCTLMVVPSTGYIMNDKLPKQHRDYYDDWFLDTIKSSDNFTYIDLRDTFKANKDKEQLYYKTDHHITSEGALLLYQAFCDSQGLTPETFTLSRTIDGFYGTSYSKSGLWLKEPDTIDIYESTDPSKYTVTIDNKEYDSLFFPEKEETADKYEVFLNGNHPLTIIKNNSNQNGKKLLIVKDSYSHCFATMLAENYEELILVDLRYYRDSTKDLLEEYGITDVLFLYGIENLATSTDFGWLSY